MHVLRESCLGGWCLNHYCGGEDGCGLPGLLALIYLRLFLTLFQFTSTLAIAKHLLFTLQRFLAFRVWCAAFFQLLVLLLLLVEER